MNRYGWMVVRAYLPALIALALAVVAMVWTSLFNHSASLNGLVPYAKWIPPFALLGALVAGLLGINDRDSGLARQRVLDGMGLPET